MFFIFCSRPNLCFLFFSSKKNFDTSHELFLKLLYVLLIISSWRYYIYIYINFTKKINSKECNTYFWSLSNLWDSDLQKFLKYMFIWITWYHLKLIPTSIITQPHHHLPQSVVNLSIHQNFSQNYQNCFFKRILLRCLFEIYSSSESLEKISMPQVFTFF